MLRASIKRKETTAVKLLEKRLHKLKAKEVLEMLARVLLVPEV